MSDERKTVLACIDGSTWSEAVTDYAAWVARTVQGPLKLLHNIESPGLLQADLSGSIGLGAREELLEELTMLEEQRSRLLMKHGRALLDRACEQALEEGVVDPQPVLRHDSLVDSLIVMEQEIRVLVLGVRGEQHDHSERLLGAQLETVIRAMHRPVLVVNRPFERSPARFMLAYDGSVAARKALDMVATSPLYTGMDCHLVHVSRDEAKSLALLEEAQVFLKAAAPRLVVHCQRLLGEGEEPMLNYQQAEDIDLIVMGAFGHGRLRELLFGSRTVNMLSASRVPLLLLR